MINLGSHSGKNMPSIYLPPTLTDRILEGLSILIMVVVWVLAIVFYSDLPDPPRKLLVPPIGIVVVTAVFLWSSRAPIRFYNFPVKLTERNYVMQLLFARRLLRVENIIVNLLLLCSLLVEVEFLFNVKTGLFTLLAFGFCILVFAALIVYYIFAFRYR